MVVDRSLEELFTVAWRLGVLAGVLVGNFATADSKYRAAGPEPAMMELAPTHRLLYSTCHPPLAVPQTRLSETR